MLVAYAALHMRWHSYIQVLFDRRLGIRLRRGVLKLFPYLLSASGLHRLYLCDFDLRLNSVGFDGLCLYRLTECE